jgi:hypothetical protein
MLRCGANFEPPALGNGHLIHQAADRHYQGGTLPSGNPGFLTIYRLSLSDNYQIVAVCCDKGTAFGQTWWYISHINFSGAGRVWSGRLESVGYAASHLVRRLALDEVWGHTLRSRTLVRLLFCAPNPPPHVALCVSVDNDYHKLSIAVGLRPRPERPSNFGGEGSQSRVPSLFISRQNIDVVRGGRSGTPTRPAGFAPQREGQICMPHLGALIFGTDKATK